MRFEQALSRLHRHPRTWLITGVAGFVGSNILEFLLLHHQFVIGVDNFSTGYQQNLDEVRQTVGPANWQNFQFFQQDIRDPQVCRMACNQVDYVLHHAALGSVTRSIHDPIATNSVNVDGFLNMLIASRDAKVSRFIYAGSSSTYGDDDRLPKIEHQIGAPLSPYAVTKYVNELYAATFHKTYGLDSIGLRYFNVFGKRQNKHGPYAAVIPTWISTMLNQDTIFINGDGLSSRDFCYIENVIQANILAATTDDESAKNQIYNIALNDNTNLNQLFIYLKNALTTHGIQYDKAPIYREFRTGDIRHTEADISKAKHHLGYNPIFKIQDGIKHTVSWYVELIHEKNYSYNQ